MSSTETLSSAQGSFAEGFPTAQGSFVEGFPSPQGSFAEDFPTPQGSFAIYKLPHTSRCTLVEQLGDEPQQLASAVDLNGRKGFVLAPFSPTADCPLLFIRPDRVSNFECDAALLQVTEKAPKYGAAQVTEEALECDAIPLQVTEKALECGAIPLQVTEKAFADEELPASRQSYHQDFSTFHQAITSGQFQKLVLARRDTQPRNEQTSPLELFSKACRLYPQLFVALVSTPVSGVWLTATPEVLLEGVGAQWRTIALAGTMEAPDDRVWPEKDKQEQGFVASYVADTLQHLGLTFSTTGPHTVSAAGLLHLCTDFTFSLYNKCTREGDLPSTPCSTREGDLLSPSCSTHEGDLLSALHPTPAVCGLPKADALRFILEHEHCPRRYYSGFMGPLNTPDTHLYVSLRCMQITPAGYHLYAGGGLLAESTEETEWRETEAKMQTMRRLLA